MTISNDINLREDLLTTHWFQKLKDLMRCFINIVGVIWPRLTIRIKPSKARRTGTLLIMEYFFCRRVYVLKPNYRRENMLGLHEIWNMIKFLFFTDFQATAVTIATPCIVLCLKGENFNFKAVAKNPSSAHKSSQTLYNEFCSTHKH